MSKTALNSGREIRLGTITHVLVIFWLLHSDIICGVLQAKGQLDRFYNSRKMTLNRDTRVDFSDEIENCGHSHETLRNFVQVGQRKAQLISVPLKEV